MATQDKLKLVRRYLETANLVKLSEATGIKYWKLRELKMGGDPRYSIVDIIFNYMNNNK